MINKTTINKIKQYAIDKDWNVAFGGKSKGNRHLARVVKIAVFIAKKENANIKISESGAWLHDIGLIAGNDDNPQKIREIADNFLKTLLISGNEKEQIAECVESHEGTTNPKSLEAKIIHDADALDKIGPLGVVRHTWKITNLINKNASSDEIFQILKQHLSWRKSRLFTNTAIQLSSLLGQSLSSFFADKKHALSIIDQITILAKRSFTTEQIVKLLIKKEKSNFTKLLEKQLKCDYLKP